MEKMEQSRLSGYQDFTSPENKMGLPMRISSGMKSSTGVGVHSEFKIPQHMAGWRESKSTHAHPGAVSTALTTLMGRSVIHNTKQAAYIKSVNLELLAPVLVDSDILGEAEVVKLRGSREALVQGSLINQSGELLARCTATYELFSSEELRTRANCQPGDINSFDTMLASF